MSPSADADGFSIDRDGIDRDGVGRDRIGRDGVDAPTIAIVDYGIGNLHSAVKALQRQGANAVLTRQPDRIADADAVVLPGVGAFGACMTALRKLELESPVRSAVESGRPFLGICVGTQMLFDGSEEAPDVAGLGLIPGRVTWLPTTVKRPQMQWNRLLPARPDPLFDGLDEMPWMYFVHSLHGVPSDQTAVAATCEYGSILNAAFRVENVFAAQFHPEKSAQPGLTLLANFVRQAAGAVVEVGR